jgi:pimeloyl-ACP methyl ester carboxylesterase
LFDLLLALAPIGQTRAMFIATDDCLLRSVAFGPATTPVLALNGWSASWEAWQPTFEVLSTTTRCISYDTRGTGNSPAAPDTITLTTLVDDVFRVLDAHGVERCVLAGESLGGFVGMHAVLRDPSRFAALVTVGSPPEIGPPEQHPLVIGARANYPATVAAFVGMCFNEPNTEHLHPWGAQLFLSADPECAARLLEMGAGSPVDCAAITVPTVVVHGDIDGVVPFAVGEYLASAIPGARLVRLEGAGHAPTVTRPLEMADLLRELTI